MKKIQLLSLFIVTAFAVSCASVSVRTDYDDATDFSSYKTYGFLKDGIDKAEISDLDKKRIMKALDAELTARGFTPSDKPDIYVNFFTKASKNVNVNNWGGYGGWGYGGFGWGGYGGYGWGGPWGWGGNYSSVSTSTEGTLYLDIIDAKKKELVWQGIGTGVLTQDREQKQERIAEFVKKIVAEYPPKKSK